MVTVDAGFTARELAADLRVRGARWILRIKGNQKTLHARLKALPWAEVPEAARVRSVGHGRIETRTIRVIDLDGSTDGHGDFSGEDPALSAGEPFQDHDAGVVLELVGLVGEDVPHEAADCLGRGVAGGGGRADEVGQPLLAEELPLGGTGLGDAVGVEHQAVAGLQAGLTGGRLGLLQAQRPAGPSVS